MNVQQAGRRGGLARAKRLTPVERHLISLNAALRRWGQHQPPMPEPLVAAKLWRDGKMRYGFADLDGVELARAKQRIRELQQENALLRELLGMRVKVSK